MVTLAEIGFKPGETLGMGAARLGLPMAPLMRATELYARDAVDEHLEDRLDVSDALVSMAHRSMRAEAEALRNASGHHPSLGASAFSASGIDPAGLHRQLDRAAELHLERAGEAWSHLDVGSRARLTQLLTGESERSRLARRDFEALVGRSTWTSKAADANARALLSVLHRPALWPDNVVPVHLPRAVPARVAELGRVDHVFEGNLRAPADHFAVEIEGHTIDLFVTSERDPAKGVFVATEEVVRALARLPAMLRQTIERVHVEPERKRTDMLNHLDLYLKDPDSVPRARMSAQNGDVWIFPQLAAQSPEDLFKSLCHEAGHLWSFSRWGSDVRGEGWQPWLDAMTLDPYTTTQYSRDFGVEDFAESIASWVVTGDTEAGAKARALMPARWQLLDRYLGV